MRNVQCSKFDRISHHETTPSGCRTCSDPVAAIDRRMDEKFAKIHQRFDRLEALMLQKFSELPEKVFGFAKGAGKESK